MRDFLIIISKFFNMQYVIGIFNRSVVFAANFVRECFA